MNRRTYLKITSLAGAASVLPAAPPARPIQLHVDLDVANEKEMLATYRTHFRPAISKQPGFVEVRLLKLVSAVVGSAPANVNYRLLLSFQTEEQRKAWVETPEHKKIWPMMEKTLKGYSALLFQVS